MRHRVFGKQLSRNTAHRRALRRNMAASLFEHGAIRTTIVKAKQIRSFVERLITTARKGTLHARRQVIAALQDRDIVDKDGNLADKTVVQKLMDEIAPRYANRPGGYTRIIRLSDRRIGDAGETCLLQLVEESSSAAADKAAGSRRRRRAAKRQSASQAQAEQAPAAEAQKPAEEPKAEEKKE